MHTATYDYMDTHIAGVGEREIGVEGRRCIQLRITIKILILRV